MAKPQSAFSVRIDEKLLRERLRRLEDIGAAGRQAAHRLLNSVADATMGRAANNLKTGGTNAKFDLTRSFGRNLSSIGRNRLLMKVYNDAPHAAFVEFGTKAEGKASPKNRETEAMRRDAGYVYGLGVSPLPPLDKITEWTRIKGLPEEAAYPIARKIAAVGIPAQPYLGPAAAYERSQAVRRMRQAGMVIRRRAP